MALVIWGTQTLAVTGRKKEAWPSFASDIGGTFTSGSSGQPDQVIASIEEWPCYLDTYVVGTRQSLVDYTRLRAFYPVHEPFELTVCTRDAVDVNTVNRRLVDVPVPHEFHNLVISTSDPARVWTLLEPITRQLLTLRPLNLQIRRRRNWPGGGVSNSVYEVHFQQSGVITSAAQLHAIYDLVSACLHQLHLMGIAGKSFSELP